jgi:hypothetical protein
MGPPVTYSFPSSGPPTGTPKVDILPGLAAHDQIAVDAESLTGMYAERGDTRNPITLTTSSQRSICPNGLAETVAGQRLGRLLEKRASSWTRGAQMPLYEVGTHTAHPRSCLLPLTRCKHLTSGEKVCTQDSGIAYEVST